MLHSLKYLWYSLRSSLWFVPTLIVAGMVGLAVALIEANNVVAPDLLARWPRLFGAGAEGTRGMLSTIATAMITVAGVVFSITIVVLSLTSSQYTSRLLRNFMGDRSHQIVLGTFVGIYAYCLVVLRTVRGEDEGSFVPSLAALGAMLLAFVGIAVLIHFIHHISTSIQASRILVRIREETLSAISLMFPEHLGDSPAPAEEQVPSIDGARWQPIPAHRTGYVQSIDNDGLLRLTEKHDAVVRMRARIGEFVIEGLPIADVAGPAEEAIAQFAGAFVIDEQRTIEQDPEYGMRQITDIALKALSPAVNDPTTAAMCVDHLTALVVELASRAFPSRLRLSKGKLRVIAQAPTFQSIIEADLDEVRLAAAGQPAVLRRLARLIETVEPRVERPDRRRALELLLARVAVTVDALDDADSRLELSREVGSVRKRLVQREPEG